ncbi:MAG: SDR family oxidoreductase [Bacteroides sp.]|nr:SDR family oxidoreductase [Roseburia sp.]MCM1345674.1 SDR family oxidoreductase [Bacteroides sp.]MCM1420443.1 SDR family oxidoreductase [Bacteroides sp.]
MISLKGKFAVVTGGSGVLGSNVSQGLLEAGATVLVIGAHQSKVDAAVERLKQYGDVHGLVCNVLDPEEIEKARDYVVDKWHRIDILVNAAGGNVPGATIMDDQSVFDMKREDLNKVIDLNLYGTIYPCLAFGKIMAAQKSGNIINVSSMAAYDSLSRVMGYSIAKEGVNALTKWLAQEMAIKYSEKIRVNAIAPGFFIGEQNRSALLNEDGSLTERSHKVLAKTPMRRFGDISELNGIVRFLCSDEASFVTGAIIPVDGGFSSFSGV